MHSVLQVVRLGTVYPVTRVILFCVVFLKRYLG